MDAAGIAAQALNGVTDAAPMVAGSVPAVAAGADVAIQVATPAAAAEAPVGQPSLVQGAAGSQSFLLKHAFASCLRAPTPLVSTVFYCCFDNQINLAAFMNTSNERALCLTCL